MDYYTPTQAAEAMGITGRALRKRIERGEVQATRLSAHVVLIPAAEVERLRDVGKFKPGRKRKQQPEDEATE